MTKRKKTSKNETFKEHYSLGQSFTMLSTDILSHPAYKALSDKHRLILLQLLAHLSLEASRTGNTLLNDGFSYTWKMCKEDCSENTFSAAMKEFVRIGWIGRNLPGPNNLNWERNVYHISRKWRQYAFTEEESGIRQQKASYKELRLKKKKSAKLGFIRKIFTPNA